MVVDPEDIRPKKKSANAKSLNFRNGKILSKKKDNTDIQKKKNPKVPYQTEKNRLIN